MRQMWTLYRRKRSSMTTVQGKMTPLTSSGYDVIENAKIQWFTMQNCIIAQ